MLLLLLLVLDGADGEVEIALAFAAVGVFWELGATFAFALEAGLDGALVDGVGPDALIAERLEVAVASAAGMAEVGGLGFGDSQDATEDTTEGALGAGAAGVVVDLRLEAGEVGDTGTEAAPCTGATPAAAAAAFVAEEDEEDGVVARTAAAGGRVAVTAVGVCTVDLAAAGSGAPMPALPLPLPPPLTARVGGSGLALREARCERRPLTLGALPASKSTISPPDKLSYSNKPLAT